MIKVKFSLRTLRHGICTYFKCVHLYGTEQSDYGFKDQITCSGLTLDP